MSTLRFLHVSNHLQVFIAVVNCNSHCIAPGWNGFIYVLNGTGLFGGPDKWTESDAHHTLVLGPGDHVEVKNEVTISFVPKTNIHHMPHLFNRKKNSYILY